MNRIRDEGLRRSQAMATLEELSDRYGPRLTASPEARAAAEWASATLRRFGLADAHLEAFDFGEGWSFRRCAVRMTEPVPAQLVSVPRAWTPGTAGPIHGPAVYVPLQSDADFAAQRGKLRGKIVLLSAAREAPARDGVDTDEAPFRRYTRAELDKLKQHYPIGGEAAVDFRARARQRYATADRLNRFLVAEGALASVEISRSDNGVVTIGGGGSFGVPGRSRGVPSIVMAAEGYQRIVRLLAREVPVELEIDVEAEFHAEDPHGYSVIADLPGGDRKDEVVMLGAHLDSWHAATGATDDGAGVAAVMEAARILVAAGLQPRRTIRVALWGGEEQGEVGSRAYVRSHFAERPETNDPEDATLPRWLLDPAWPIRVKPEHARLSAYFNLDYGAGRIRGIYAQGNVAVVPIFSAWLRPLEDLGADTVLSQGPPFPTDHQSFDDVGLPGFQFVQDELDYETRAHHSTLDTPEHVPSADLVQMAVVLAAFAWQAAERDDLLPRKPMPQSPR